MMIYEPTRTHLSISESNSQFNNGIFSLTTAATHDNQSTWTCCLNTTAWREATPETFYLQTTSVSKIMTRAIRMHIHGRISWVIAIGLPILVVEVRFVVSCSIWRLNVVWKVTSLSNLIILQALPNRAWKSIWENVILRLRIMIRSYTMSWSCYTNWAWRDWETWICKMHWLRMLVLRWSRRHWMVLSTVVQFRLTS